MNATAIKQEMHNAIDVINDKEFLKAVYVILNEKSKEYDLELNTEEINELENLRKQHKLGKSKSYTVAEVRKREISKLKK